MKKSVLMSIQPYWGFLTIAKAKGWDLKKYGLHEKTVEVRKGAPKDPDWDKTVELYFTKDKKSLARIPEEYRKEVEALCGKVVAEFTCAKIHKIDNKGSQFIINNDIALTNRIGARSRLDFDDMKRYLGTKDGYAWEIESLKVYDEPKELSEFRKECKKDIGWDVKTVPVFYPPQSWCYVEEI